MKKLHLWTIVCLSVFLSTGQVFAQNTPTIVKGLVLELSDKGDFTPLAGATVQWLGTANGTATDSNGVFSLAATEQSNKLIVSFLGYKADTILVKNPKITRVVLQQNGVLSEVNIEFSRSSSYISAIEPVRTQIMTEKELFKAACCNLSESFETNPSVDVAFSDAVSGAKQIQMLGLAGVYTQLTTENLPATRGLAASHGLAYTPGSWIESIQVTKGIGSVANGFESVAGQINVELRKPEKTDKLFFNAYFNDMGRAEANLNLSQKVGKKWSTGVLLHGNYLANKLDMNNDGFLDIPTGQQLNFVNRWKYDNNKGLMAQIGIRAMDDTREGGQRGFNHETPENTPNIYGIHIATQRNEVFGKIGYVFPAKKYKSLGVMASFTDHKIRSYFGENAIFSNIRYNARQKSAYANFIYQSIIGTTQHKWRAGASVQADRYNEDFVQANYRRNEQTSGVFGEYTYAPQPSFSLVLGLRADYNNLFGAFVTPRLHAKYDLSENTIVRASYGRGQRTANIFVENMAAFVSSRNLQVMQSNNKAAYGLNPEVAWNGGLSLTHDFKLWYNKGSFSLDYFRTDFQEQVVADFDASAQQLLLYNLKGKSFSNSVQAEVNYQPIRRLEVKVVYRWLDVRTQYSNALLQKPLIAKNRMFVNLAYETRSKWKFDVTAQWWGSKRLPSTAANPHHYQMHEKSPSFWQFNAQVSKGFGKRLEVYLGGENLANFRQKNLIISADNTSSPSFDASIVWGPIIGRMMYTGLRYRF